MKLKKSRLLIVALYVSGLLTIVGCSKNSCVATDFTGTYVGTTECVGAQPSTNDTIVVSRISDIQIGITTDQFNLEATLDGCDLDLNETLIGGNGRTGSVSLDGETLTVQYQTLVGGILAQDCTFTGTRQ